MKSPVDAPKRRVLSALVKLGFVVVREAPQLLEGSDRKAVSGVPSGPFRPWRGTLLSSPFAQG